MPVKLIKCYILVLKNCAYTTPFLFASLVTNLSYKLLTDFSCLFANLQSSKKIDIYIYIYIYNYNHMINTVVAIAAISYIISICHAWLPKRLIISAITIAIAIATCFFTYS